MKDLHVKFEHDTGKRVTQLLVESVGIRESEVSLDDKLVDDLGFDSLDLVEFIMAIEEAFGLDDIPDKSAEAFVTVRNVIDYIENTVKK